MGGGGGGGVALCPNPHSLGDESVSKYSSLMKVWSATFFWISSRLSGAGTFRGPGGPVGPGGPGGPGAGESAGMSDAAGGDTTFSLGVNSEVTCSGDASEKWTHFSSVLTATDLGDNTGPKMLSKSLMDGSFSILASVGDWSFPGATVKGEPVRGGVAGTFFGGSGGGVPVGNGLDNFGDSRLELIG